MRPMTTLKTVNGTEKQVGWCDAVWCQIEKRRVRFSKQLPDGMVEVVTDDGKKLPDLRHPSQLWAV